MIGQLGPEVSAVLREGMALEARGLLDAQATARIEARLDAILQSQQRNWQIQQQHAIADLDASTAQSVAAGGGYQGIPRKLQIAVAVTVAAAFAGMLLEVTIGRGFIWSASFAYSAAAGWLLLALMPLCAVYLYVDERATGSLRSRHPNGLVRWVFMYPMLVVFLASLLVFTPWGWSALLGWTVGTPSRVNVQVVSVQAVSKRSLPCKQSAQLGFKGAMASICLDGRLAGAVPAAGFIGTLVTW